MQDSIGQSFHLFSFTDKLPNAMNRFRIGILLLLPVFALMQFTAKTMRIHTMAGDNGDVMFVFGQASILLTAMASILAILSATLIALSKVGFLRFAAVLVFVLGSIIGFAAIDLSRDEIRIGRTSIALPMHGFPMRDHAVLEYSELSGVIVDRGRLEMEFLSKKGEKVIIPMGDLVREAEQSITDALLANGVVVAGL